jgi:kynurenine formamidase
MKLIDLSQTIEPGIPLSSPQAPIKFTGAAAFPVRAYAVVEA